MSSPSRSRATMGIRCLGIAMNAICAGGLMTYPLFSSALVQHHHFTQAQLTTIILAGMVGQYPFAAIVGKILDTRGARTCSLIAAFMFSLGFGLFADEVADAPEYPKAEETTHVFRRMVVYFGMIGLGTVFSYFSIVFSATQTFPQYIGVASGTAMAIFGCSPLFLTSLADRYFTSVNPTGEPVLNVTHFVACLSIVTGLAHLLGAFTLPGPVSVVSIALSAIEVEQPAPVVRARLEGARDEDEPSGSAESSPLLRGQRSSSRSSSNKSLPVQIDITLAEVLEVPPPQHGSTLDLLHDPWFWALFIVATIVVGCGEMVIANLSSIFLSLRTPSVQSITFLLHSAETFAAGTTISRQVQVLSLSNTLARLAIGPLVDLVAPVPVAFHRSSETTQPGPQYTSSIDTQDESDEEHNNIPLKTKADVYFAFPRTHYISRVAFLLGSCLLLLTTFTLFLVINSSSQNAESMTVLSVGIGTSYGIAFTLMPGILTAIWGSANLGRNFGILSYAPFIGTSAFSYMYAFLVDRHSTPAEPASPLRELSEGSTSTCTGPQCWQTTFSVCIGSLALACCVTGALWKQWQGRV